MGGGACAPPLGGPPHAVSSETEGGDADIPDSGAEDVPTADGLSESSPGDEHAPRADGVLGDAASPDASGTDAAGGDGQDEAGAGPQQDAGLSDAGPGGDNEADTGPGDTGPPADTAADAWECPPGSPCDLPYAGFCYTGVCDEAGVCQQQKIPGCCLDDGDCSGADAPAAAGPCEVARCVAYQCQVVAVPGCCGGQDACADGVACTVDACDLTTRRCSWCPAGCMCGDGAAEGAVVWSADFSAPDLGAQGFTLVDYQPWDSVGWQVDQARWRSPPAALYLGDPICRTYDTGALDADCQPLGGAGPVRAALYTPLFAVPSGGVGQVAVLWVWADVEPPSGPGASPDAEPDTLRVFVEDATSGGLSWERASTLDVGKSTAGQWAPLVVDLSPWRGGAVRLRLEFDTLDGLANHHEGIYVDDLTVLDRCAAGCCTDDAQCSEAAGGDPCQVGRCVGAAGATPGVCVAAPRTPGEPCQPCAPGDACGDDDPCTNDACGAWGICEHTTFCCLERPGPVFSFEDGLLGWFVDSAPPALPEADGQAVASWHAVPGDSPAGGKMAWLGRLDTATYDTGARVQVGLRSQPLTLPSADGGHELVVRFWFKLSTEWDDAPSYFNPGGLDRLSLSLEAAPGSGEPATELWSSDAVDGTTQGAWVPVTVPLPGWTPPGAALRWLFDSGDAANNDYGGPALDQVEVVGRCP